MKTRRRTTKALSRVVMLALVSILWGGCATQAVFESGMRDTFHEPSIANHLAIYESRNKEDFLVEYDELAPGKDTPVRRAYYLLENASAIKCLRKPRFVSFDLEPRGTPVPLITVSNLSANPFAACPTYAIAQSHQKFAIYREANRLIGEYELPSYRSSAGLVKRVFVMPLAIGLDFCGAHIIGLASSGQHVGYVP